MDILHDVLGFAAKGFVVFATIAVTALFLVTLVRRRRPRTWLRVNPLNQRIDAMGDALRASVMRKRDLRKLRQQRKKAKAAGRKPNVFVLEFKGDLFASAVRDLREEVTAIAAVAGKDDEVVVRLESAGGAVPHYGLAAAQLMRLRDKAIKVTVCIDRIAASGGYMMACVADQIVAAPFAIIGSIGVVAQVPNFHRLLKKHDVDFQEMTAGEFKRTVSVFGEITERGRKKFQEELEDTHAVQGLRQGAPAEARPRASGHGRALAGAARPDAGARRSTRHQRRISGWPRRGEQRLPGDLREGAFAA